MKLKKLFPLILLIFSLFQIKCSQNKTICHDIQIINKKLNIEIDKFYNQSESWNLQNSKMSEIKIVLNNLEEQFDLLNSSILHSEPKNEKKQIIKVLDAFINKMEMNEKNNKEHLWIINNAKNELYDLVNNIDLCDEIALNKSHSIEKTLVNSFYLIAYTDAYSFNKIEPIVSVYYDQINFTDTINFALGHLAYDSTACSITQVTVTNDNGVYKDSTNCNWLSIPRVKGLNLFEGEFHYQMYGKKEVMSFSEEIYIK